MSIRLDPEDMCGILDKLYRCCEEIVERYGGRISQYIGENVQGLTHLRDKVQLYSAANPADGLLICKSTDYNLFGDKVATTRQLLDQAIADRPAIFIASDHHTAWANTVALERADAMHGRSVASGG